ncbi:MAG: hypothetical protein ACREQB_07140 [Candidatus Binataceae bacterium]
MEEKLNARSHQEEKMEDKGTLDERLPGLFEPDTLLPIQYFEAMRKKHLLEGEKRLVLSVLEDAVECFMKCIDSATNKGQRLFRDADEWISTVDKRWVFSFDNVCEMLDVNPEYMREGLRKWKERKLIDIDRKRAERERLAADAAAAPEQVAIIEPSAPASAAIAAKVARPVAKSAKVVALPRRPRRKVGRVAASARGRKLRKARA